MDLRRLKSSRTRLVICATSSNASIQITWYSNDVLKISIDARTKVQLRVDAKPENAFGSDAASFFLVATKSTRLSVNVT
jgi:ribosomal protein L18